MTARYLPNSVAVRPNRLPVVVDLLPQMRPVVLALNPDKMLEVLVVEGVGSLENHRLPSLEKIFEETVFTKVKNPLTPMTGLLHLPMVCAPMMATCRMCGRAESLSN